MGIFHVRRTPGDIIDFVRSSLALDLAANSERLIAHLVAFGRAHLVGVGSGLLELSERFASTRMSMTMSPPG